MTIRIRRAVPGDEGLVLKFIHDLAEYEKLSHEVTARADDIRQALFAPAPKVFALIAEDFSGNDPHAAVGQSGAPIGFAMYFFSFSTFLGCHGVYLEDLFVDEAARGKGAGKMLLAELAAIAVAEGCGRLEWSVLDWNAPSIAFYRSMGAEPMDEWTVYRLTGDALNRLAGGPS